MPQDAEDYVHRIGRTARFGSSGVAISFICEQYAYSMPDIEDYIGQKIPVQPIPKMLLAEIVIPQRKPEQIKSGYQGKHPSSQRREQSSKFRPLIRENPQSQDKS